MSAKKVVFAVVLVWEGLLGRLRTDGAPHGGTVNESGVDPTNGITYINLTMVDLYSGTGTWTGGRWFMATGDYKSLLAVGLSAIASNSYVTVNLASDPPEAYSVIIGIFQRNYSE